MQRGILNEKPTFSFSKIQNILFQIFVFLNNLFFCCCQCFYFQSVTES